MASMTLRSHSPAIPSTTAKITSCEQIQSPLRAQIPFQETMHRLLWNAACRDIPVAMSGYDIWLRNLVATFQLRHSSRGIRLRNLVADTGCSISDCSTQSLVFVLLLSFHCLTAAFYCLRAAVFEGNYITSVNGFGPC